MPLTDDVKFLHLQFHPKPSPDNTLKMAQSSVGPPSTFRSFYPHMSDSYNDQATSDIILCFGDSEKVYAHKVILKAASGVWKQAFNSKLPISTSSTYNIQGHPDFVIYTMLRHVYGMPLVVKRFGVSEKAQIDYLFDVFAIANDIRFLRLARLSQKVLFNS
jgi:hypothetical protein